MYRRHGRWYLAVGMVLFSTSVIMTLAAITSNSWIEVETTGSEYADSIKADGGKSETIWILMSFAFAVGLLSMVMLFLRFWKFDNIPGWFFEAGVVGAVVEGSLVLAAWVTFIDDTTLQVHQQYGVGYGLAFSTWVAAFLGVVLFVLHRIMRPGRDALNTSHRHLCLSFFVLFLYLQLGALFYEHVETWNFRIASQFCLVSITTIGYGDVVPETALGRAALFIYAPVGFAWIGYSVRTFWTILLHKVEQQIKRQKTLKRVNTKKEMKEVEKKTEQDTKMRMWISFFTLTLDLFLGAIIFYVGDETKDGKQWTFFESLYCSFITLTTIGYGDFVPQETNVFLFTAYVLVGLGALGAFLTLMGQALVLRVSRKIDQVSAEDVVVTVSAEFHAIVENMITKVDNVVTLHGADQPSIADIKMDSLGDVETIEVNKKELQKLKDSIELLKTLSAKLRDHRDTEHKNNHYSSPIEFGPPEHVLRMRSDEAREMDEDENYKAPLAVNTI